MLRFIRVRVGKLGRAKRLSNTIGFALVHLGEPRGHQVHSGSRGFTPSPRGCRVHYG